TNRVLSSWMSPWGGWREQELQVVAQVGNGVEHGARVVVRLGKNKRALQHGLGVAGQAFGAAAGAGGMAFERGPDGRHQRLRVGLYSRRACGPERRVAGEGFLRQGAPQAGRSEGHTSALQSRE